MCQSFDNVHCAFAYDDCGSKITTPPVVAPSTRKAALVVGNALKLTHSHLSPCPWHWLRKAMPIRTTCEAEARSHCKGKCAAGTINGCVRSHKGSPQTVFQTGLRQVVAPNGYAAGFAPHSLPFQTVSIGGQLCRMDCVEGFFPQEFVPDSLPIWSLRPYIFYYFDWFHTFL